MSIEEVERTIPLSVHQLFAHSALLEPELARFQDSFERNQRFKEFEGLIRANHRIYEALETKIGVEPSKMSALASKMNALAVRIGDIGRPHFTKEELLGLDLSNMVEMAKQAEAKQKQLERSRGNGSAGKAGEVGQILPTLEEE